MDPCTGAHMLTAPLLVWISHGFAGSSLGATEVAWPLSLARRMVSYQPDKLTFALAGLVPPRPITRPIPSPDPDARPFAVAGTPGDGSAG